MQKPHMLRVPWDVWDAIEKLCKDIPRTKPTQLAISYLNICIEHKTNPHKIAANGEENKSAGRPTKEKELIGKYIIKYNNKIYDLNNLKLLICTTEGPSWKFPTDNGGFGKDHMKEAVKLITARRHMLCSSHGMEPEDVLDMLLKPFDFKWDDADEEYQAKDLVVQEFENRTGKRADRSDMDHVAEVEAPYDPTVPDPELG